jgi:hypothetical protein
MQVRARRLGGVAVALLFVTAGCSTSSLPLGDSSTGGSAAPQSGSTATTSASQSGSTATTSASQPGGISTSTTSTRGTTPTQTAACTLPVTTDSYDGFHVGVPPGWEVLPLDGSVVVSRDSTGTEEAVVRPALLASGVTPSSFFSASLSALQKEIADAHGTMDISAETGGTMPSASLTLQAGGVSMEGQADVEVLPEATAHGTEEVATVASWAPDSRFASDRSMLADIGKCFGPSPATLFQIVEDQAFAYAIPLGWKTTSEGQDEIVIADGTKASASYLLTLATPQDGVSSAATLLSWAFPQIGIKITKTVATTTFADQTTSTGAVQSQEYVEFLGVNGGQAVHGLVSVLCVAESDGIASGTIRIGMSTTALWNSTNGALIQMMGAIQHNFTQDLQEFARLSQEWQDFDQQEQGFDDALNGVDIVTDPGTGQSYEAPYSAYDPDGPDGPGYYIGDQKLTVTTP